jgi:hypothetical protein
VSQLCFMLPFNHRDPVTLNMTSLLHAKPATNLNYSSTQNLIRPSVTKTTQSNHKQNSITQTP